MTPILWCAASFFAVQSCLILRTVLNTWPIHCTFEYELDVALPRSNVPYECRSGTLGEVKSTYFIGKDILYVRPRTFRSG